MAALLLGIFLALPFLTATSYIENGFAYPANSKDFPYQFSNVSFDGNKTLTLPERKSELIGFFVIGLNESDIPHEIELSPNNSTIYTRDSEHHQTITLYSDTQSSFYWRTVYDAMELRNFSTPFNSRIDGLDKDKMKIQFYANGTTIYNDEHIVDVPVQYNYTYGNNFHVPFNISWNHEFVPFTLKMGNGIKLAFFEGQFENPPSMMEWPLLPATTTTDIPTTTPYSEAEFDFSFFIQQNFTLLIMIAILFFLLLGWLIRKIFLNCCSKKSN